MKSSRSAKLSLNVSSRTVNVSETGTVAPLSSRSANFSLLRTSRPAAPPFQLIWANPNSMQMTRALQIQMEVQRKLHEQIEVQKHLQLRVEAQGKYLQSVLGKAQDTISDYGSCSMEAENARDELAELVSMVNSTCQKAGPLNKVLGHHGSLESSLTSSSECSCYKNENKNFISLSLMEMHPATKAMQLEQSTIDLNCKELNDLDR